MKKLIIVIFLIFVSALCFGQTAVIKNISGIVELKKSGSSVWVPAEEGGVVEKSTVVSTGFRSTAVIAIGNSSIFVQPLTRLTLDEIITMNQSENVSINLNTGRVRVEVNPPSGTRSNLTVQTPSTTASVRGTVFEMDTVNIKVYEGEVSFASVVNTSSRSVSVNAGKKSRTDNSGNVLTPMTVEDMERLIESPSVSVRIRRSSGSTPPSPETGEVEIGIEFEPKGD